ncbi:TIGR03364 family FAD-dependent oxidoreductase [filamentous cyanobacterium CCP1]|nr:TIGR03364 family FAD-dependent oxidoreductase [filamentous cyanobacterium CCP2]PSB68155.1 TIGR03364 family FAD-dependent oxidoreductase [filamentous cyanobacterium CCP1]
MSHANFLVVGAGIVGLAHALAVAKRGFKVVVFDRSPRAVGASIRNFGMVWPIGQPLGTLTDRALLSRQIWGEVASEAGFHLEEAGSLHLAYRADEWAVLQEFFETRNDHDAIRLLSPAEAIEKSPAVVTEGLIGALWSATEAIVDPREAIWTLPDYLSEKYGVTFKFGTAVTNISGNKLTTAAGEHWQGDRILVCSGADFETLYPHHFAESGITKVKLQMLRTVPQPDRWRMGAALCGGLTLTHYGAFAHCATLSALKERIAAETPHFPKWGIHVMMSQNGSGELIIGDSHEYGLNPSPFDKAEINQYVLDYLRGFARVPALEIAETWHGIYAKLLNQTELILHPEEPVTIVNALGGAGMTLSFGLAEQTISTEISGV